MIQAALLQLPQKASPLPHLLVYPVQTSTGTNDSTPTHHKRSAPKARLLITYQSLAMLKVKERAKGEAALEKKN